jgi:hypothetical protein
MGYNPTSTFGSTVLYTAQVTVSATPTALTAASFVGANEILLQNDPASTVNIRIGTDSAQYVSLVPGASLTIPFRVAGKIYHSTASSTATLNILARD